MPAQRPYRARTGRAELACGHLVALAGLLCCCLLPATAAFAAQVQQASDTGAQTGRSKLSEPEVLLVGGYVHGKERSMFEVLRVAEGFLLPLEQFVELCGCELRGSADNEEFLTPLGVVHLDADATVTIDEIRYLRQSFIEKRLATPVTFRQELFGINLNFPWRPGVTEAPRLATSKIEPEVRPPALSLTTARTELLYQHEQNRGVGSMATRVGGSAGGGLWRLRYHDRGDAAPDLRDYAWTRTFGDRLFLAGQQNVQLHPLLGSVQLTGVQAAYTNQPLALFARSSYSSELLPRRVRSAVAIRGHGPVAGIAELRIEGAVLARQLIGMSGEYEFLDIALPSRQSTRIEVYLYDRFNTAVPVEIQEHTRSASELLLPRGAVVHAAGFGLEGNLANELLESTGTGSPAGFYQGRFGITDNLTAEAAVQRAAGQTRAVASLVGTLGRGIIGAGGVAASGHGLAWDLDVGGAFQGWFFSARSRQASAGFSNFGTRASQDHQAEIGIRPFGSMTVSLIGSRRLNDRERVGFVLPAVAFSPLRATWLRARPDAQGRYRFDVSWGFHRKGRIAASRHRDVTNLGISYQLQRALRFGLTSTLVAGELNRHDATLSWSGGGAWQPSWTVGGSMTNGRPGLVLGVTARPAPGLVLSGRFDSGAAGRFPGIDDRRLLVALTSDLAFAGGRVMGASSYAFESEHGAVAGRLEVAGDYGVDPDLLQGVTVRLDGHAITQTAKGGRYFAGRVEPGVHRIEIDSDRLPIELVVRDATVYAEVGSGAVTTVDFDLDVEFGMAGRVRIGNLRWPGALVDLLDEKGKVLQTVRTDRFGLFRIDQVRVGSYRVRLSPSNAPQLNLDWPQRVVEIRDDFLFGQDLVLDPGPSRDPQSMLQFLQESKDTPSEPQVVPVAARVDPRKVKALARSLLLMRGLRVD